MDPFKVRRRWKITFQYGLDGIKREFSLPNAVITLLVIFVCCLMVLAALYLYGIQEQSRALKSLSRLQKENILLRQKLEYYSDVMDSIYQYLGVEEKAGNTSTEKLYPYYRSEPTEPLNDNTFIYDSYLDARVNSIEQKVRKIATLLDIAAPEGSGELVVYAENPDFDDFGPSIYPAFGRWSDGWGIRMHPFYHHLAFHYGVDIANRQGTPVYATAEGVVSLTGYDSDYGRIIKISHPHKFETRYGHLYSFLVSKGDHVRKGQMIALMGNTGHSTGPHLHYEVLYDGKKVNPARYLNRIDPKVYYARQ
jgi:murein DD-endopeptidase MepM/ murein hydrolase activator NlpD